jgi:prepilin peptidase CpaA
MTLHPHLVPLAGFAGLMVTAAFQDFRRLIIPNTLTLSLCILWLLYLATAPSITLAAGFVAAGCGLAVFLAGAVLFSRGLIGGGDVKLLAAATLWAGPDATMPLLILTGVFGGVLALVLLSPLGTLITLTCRPALDISAAAAAHKSTVPVPYGVAIAAAALIVTVPPNFS